jgi:uracil-DNA glycosylase family 4
MSEATAIEYSALIGALEFYIESGVRDFCTDEPNDMAAWQTTKSSFLPKATPNAPFGASNAPVSASQLRAEVNAEAAIDAEQAVQPLGKSEAIINAQARLKEVHTLDDLKKAIASFDGLGIKKTATEMVFSEGDPRSKIMIINDIPGEEEDRSGTPFAGYHRLIIELALKGINHHIVTKAEEAELVDGSAYTASFLNWRPPGNRSPQDVESEVSRLFLEKHIALVKPQVILLLGNTACKTMLSCKTNINKLRGNWQSLTIDNLDNTDKADVLNIPVMPSYAPASLLSSAKQKKLFWQDLLDVQNKLRSL